MFKSKTHEINFYNAMKEVDSENFATQAVVYLLTSETTLNLQISVVTKKIESYVNV